MPGRPAAGDTPVGICLWRLEPDHSTPFDEESTVVLDHPIALLAILVPSATGRLALALLTTLAGRPAFAQLPFMVEARVPKAPTVVTGSTGSFLVYEILVTNFEVGEIRWTGLEVTDGTGAPLLTLADSALWDNMTRPLQGRVPFLERPRLNTMQQAVLFLQVPVNGAAPMELRHRLTFADTAGTRTLSMRPVPVEREAVVVGPPLRGGNWIAVSGPGNASFHRRALLPIDGLLTIAQRFAIDYVMVDSASRPHRGEPLKNESYYGHDADAIAVADGVVVGTRDSIPENIPGGKSRAVTISLENVAGNFVMLDIGNGRYAHYAHLRPGSLRVKAGDRVRRGAVLGKVGNSGNSSLPHLHFHITDFNSPLGAEGVPYLHDTVEIVGSCRAFVAECELRPPYVLRRVLPLENEIVRFPW